MLAPSLPSRRATHPNIPPTPHQHHPRTRHPPTHAPSPQFDKDDELAVEFVTAAANLRAACYGIPPQSLFGTKVGWAL